MLQLLIVGSETDFVIPLISLAIGDEIIGADECLLATDTWLNSKLGMKYGGK